MSTWAAGDGIVVFPDGRRIRGRGLGKNSPAGVEPEFGVYLLGRDPSIEGWPCRWVRWRDFRLPDSTDDAVAALQEAHQRAASERVEVACGGGLGRTGTALAVLAIMSGIPAGNAVAWVREHYRRRAVETRHQRRWIKGVSASLAA